jgi:hypothetical protein
MRLALVTAAIVGTLLVGALVVVEHRSPQASASCSGASSDGSLTCTLGSRHVVVLANVCSPIDPSLVNDHYASANYDTTGSAPGAAAGTASQPPVAYGTQGTIVTAGQQDGSQSESAAPPDPASDTQTTGDQRSASRASFAAQLSGLLAAQPTGSTTPTGQSVSCK